MTVFNNKDYSITFYIGNFNETTPESSFSYCKKVIANGSQAEITNVPCGPELNIWFSYKPYSSVWYRSCSIGGILAKYVFLEGNTYTLEYPDPYSFTLMDNEGKYIYGDWDIEVTSKISSGSTVFVNNYLVSPKINIINSPDWGVEGTPYLVNYSSTFITGVLKFKYNKADSRRLIKLCYRLKDSSGKPIFIDYNYGTQETVAASSASYNTNCFVKNDMRSIWLLIYNKNMHPWGSSLSQLSEMDVIITSSSFSYAPPNGTLEKVGDIFEEGSYFWQEVKNTGECDIRVWGTYTLFKDENQREIIFNDWSPLYIWDGTTWQYSGDLAKNQTGRLKINKLTIYNYTTTLTPSFCFLDWDPKSTGSSLGESYGSNNLPLTLEEERSYRDWLKAREESANLNENGILSCEQVFPR